MESEITLYTRDRTWKAEVEAWKNNFLFYKSIGTEVWVFHKEKRDNVWGDPEDRWVLQPPSSVRIVNTYRGSGPGTATRERSCRKALHCELKETANGLTIELPVDSVTDIGGGAVLDIESVHGLVEVTIGGETLSGEVAASSAFSDSSVW